ncbi:Hypothetical protein ORPV_696 [Orpheovirus IHUMI-LCC2]|uniref:Uncharacterized protein n=1 Tax=Orpheovirus IHUMI-LCC2 TaxID=2023057 RepID=A0A2I2L515_9VIRU|nr:Hypothetical protein ORPV_696 [Orpheovirus IHUMI-LCC2]SNW62600.1 Hypothetical protein ORPV_696 [Orpheovirus IHUMI-LCC2]
MGNGGTWNTGQYDVDINSTIIGLHTQNFTNGKLTVPNGTYNYQGNATYQYLINNSTQYQYCNSWRSTLTFPFTFWANFEVNSTFIIIYPKVTNVSNGVNIGTVRYGGVYEGGRRSIYLPATANAQVSYLIPKTYEENFGIYDLTALTFQIDYQTP